MTDATILNHDRFIFRKDASLLFDSRTGVEHKLNATAALIVARLKEGWSIDAVSRYISERYDVDCEVVTSDIFELLGGFANPVARPQLSEFEKSSTSLPSSPFAIEFELTKLCDWKCIFCYNVWKINRTDGIGRSPTRFLDPETLYRVVDEGRREGLLRVRYSGGEPTLHPHFDEIVSRVGGLGVYQILFTNGRSISHETASYWADVNIREVMISLHGDRDSHDHLVGRKGSYERTISKLKVLKAHDFAIVVEMILTSLNIRTILNQIRYLYKELGIEQYRLMRYVPSGRPEDAGLAIDDRVLLGLIDDLRSSDLPEGLMVRFPCSPRFCLSDPRTPIDEELAAARGKYLIQHCGAGINWFSVSYDGQLRVCPHSNVYLADLKADGANVIDLWKRTMLPRVLPVLQTHATACLGCSAWNDCKGGCHLPQFLR